MVWGIAAGFAAKKWLDSRKKPRDSDESLYQRLGGTNQTDVPLDEFGYPSELPAGRIAPMVQMRANAQIAAKRQAMVGQAGSLLEQGYDVLGSYRPGGLAQIQSGILSQQAQTKLAGAQMLEDPNLMWFAERDADMKARSDARKAGYMNIAGTIVGAGLGALAGPAGAAAGAVIGNQLTQPNQPSSSTQQSSITAMSTDPGMAPQGGPQQQFGPYETQQSKLQGTGGLGPRAQQAPGGAGGGGLAPATLGGPKTEAAPRGAGPSGSPTLSPGPAGMQGETSQAGMAPQAQSGGQMRVAAAAPVAAEIGAPPEMVLSQLYEMQPDLEDEGWIDQSLGRLREMRAMDPVPAFG